ncbi:MAG: Carbohydrate ABC transporter membrane protein 2, CUT1 family [Petrotoga mobilis]|nr:MAG: Carbohydrate ABC transporter membrane protein 2, CUT1 family [Petrotoga mobilis]
MKKKKLKTNLIILISIIILIVELFPIAIIIMNSFKKDIDIWSANPFSFKPTLDSYKKVFQRNDVVLGIRNSLIVGILSTSFSLLVGAMASYAIARFKFRYRRVLSYSFLISRMIPQISLSIPLFMMFRSLGLTDTLIALIFAHMSFNIPYVIWVLLPFFSSVPIEYEEAALVDGCNRKKVFWKIFIPLVGPGLVVAAVFTFIMSWNEFLYALVLTSSTAKTAPVVINGFMGQYAPLWGQLAAAGTIMLIPVFVITLAFQRYLIGGMGGGIKG